MFSLIITIVSIALVVALVAATMYYGGDTLTQGRAQAEVTSIVAASQQIGAAAVLHRALEGVDAPSVAALIDKKYLGSLPEFAKVDGALFEGWEVDNVSGQLYHAVSEETCIAINESVGARDAASFEYSDLDRAAYGCMTDDNLFTFKFMKKLVRPY